jgi:uncharacterized protein YndB with AHSA1/START domain
MHAHTTTARFAAPPNRIFDFLADIENLPRWAVTFCQKLTRVDGGYRVTTPGGEIWFRIDGEPRTGVIDLWGGPDRGQMAQWPMRVIGDRLGGAVLTFTAIQTPAESDDIFARQCAALDHELEVLRAQVERHPQANVLTRAPLRNRMRVLLEAPVAEVWALLSDLTRLPEYSVGLDRVEATRDANGGCTEYICHFKPMAAGEAGIVSRETIRWWVPLQGYASSGAQRDAFGLGDDLNLVVLESAHDGAIVTWAEYYNAQDLPMMKAHFEEALADIGENLAKRFGGTVLERFVEGSRA